MPRIFTSANDPLDFCKRCMPEELMALHDYGDLGDGPDDRGDCYEYDAEHPPFTGDPEYKCENCSKVLWPKDD